MSPHPGLHPKVKESLRQCILQALVLWDDLPAQDIYKTVKVSSPTEFRISLEERRGIRTARELEKHLPSLESFQDLQEKLKTYNPELVEGFYICGTGSQILFKGIVEQIVKSLYPVRNEEIPQELESIIEELDQGLKAGDAEIIIYSPLKNFVAPNLKHAISLTDGVILRPLSDQEVENLYSHDALSSFPLSTRELSKFILEIKFKAKIIGGFWGEYTGANPTSDAKSSLAQAHRILHLLKSGGVEIEIEKMNFSSRALPNYIAYTINAHTSFASRYTLEEHEQKPLEEICLLLNSTTRPELDIACRRLHDAELRLNSKDALVDACIGLEALLTSYSKAEISYRMAMNFAALGLPKDKKERYKRMRHIYEARSRIVHGSKDTEEYRLGDKNRSIHEIAKAAKEALRETILLFLQDPFLRGKEQIEWEDRYF
jgi:hypothetical protein